MDTFDKFLQIAALGVEKKVLSVSDTDKKSNAPGRTRTCNLRIKHTFAAGWNGQCCIDRVIENSRKYVIQVEQIITWQPNVS
ncbi:MAG: hypothetical protein ACYS0C_08835 [Planctomycetota bacterium]|jgi:hypothetical protein